MTTKKTTAKSTPRRRTRSVQCYAMFGESVDDLVRCTDVAGHNGQHTYVVSWTDDESWSPDQIREAMSEPPQAGPMKPPAVQAAQAAAPEPDVEALAAQAQQDVPRRDPKRRCEGCNHPFHGDQECVAVTRGEHGLMPCGCATAI